MGEELAAWDYILPWLVVLGSAGVLVTVVGLAIRGARRSPRAKAAAKAEQDKAGAALVRLDNEIAEADIELALASASYGGGAPAALSNARLAGVQIRDVGFSEYHELLDGNTRVHEAKRVAWRLTTRANAAVAALQRANEQHSQWLQENGNSAAQVQRALAQARSIEATLGDAHRRDMELAERFDAREVLTVTTPANRARTLLETASASLGRAQQLTADPTRSALEDLADAQRALRDAELAAAASDQASTRLHQAAIAVSGELAGVREQIAAGVRLLESTPPDATESMSAELRAAQQAVDTLEREASRNPMLTVAELTRVRSRLDLALGDARSARARLDGAKSALPGALATARALIGRAETTMASTTNADARVRLAAARDELTRARNAGDAIEALDAARRAIRHAEDADALAS